MVLALTFGLTQSFAAVRVTFCTKGKKHKYFSVSVTWVLRGGGYSNLVI